MDLAVRSGRTVLQLHDEGGFRLVHTMAGAARCARPDQPARRPRQVRRKIGRVLFEAISPERYLPRLHRLDRPIRPRQPAGSAECILLRLGWATVENSAAGAGDSY